MSKPTGVYRVQKRDYLIGRWQDVEVLQPRTSVKEIRWLRVFSKIETMILDSPDDMRLQAVEKARALYKAEGGSGQPSGGLEVRVREEYKNDKWLGETTIWKNGSWHELE